MSLQLKLVEDLKSAMKARDNLKKDTLRMLRLRSPEHSGMTKRAIVFLTLPSKLRSTILDGHKSSRAS